MKPVILAIALLITCPFLSGCTLANVADAPATGVLPLDESFAAGEGRTLSLTVNTGQIAIHGSDGDQITIQGQLAYPNKTTYRIIESAQQITLVAEYDRSPFFSPSTTPIVLDVTVPDQVALQVDGFDAAIEITGFKGTAEISSVAGDIHADHLAGTISLQSGRGDIHLANGAGQLRVLGEHGTLTVAAAKGDVGISSIMGSIDFSGALHAEDNVRIEVDHGSVQVRLSSGSDVAIMAASTGGEVACRLPQRTFTNWGCTAEIGAAGGHLNIRTVSGRIDIGLTP